MEENITLTQYEEMLQKHDWYYMMSESPSVYENGSRNLEEILRISKINLVFKELYEVYSSKYKIK